MFDEVTSNIIFELLSLFLLWVPLLAMFKIIKVVTEI